MIDPPIARPLLTDMPTLGVPVVVVGHKWDELEANYGESETRKAGGAA